MTGFIIATKKTFTADDIEEPNNTPDNAAATNTVNDNAFGEKSCFLKIMHRLSVVFQKLMA